MLVGGANWIPHDVVMDWSQVEEPGWFRRQHSIHLDNDGDLLLLDNWNARGLRIAIDEAAKTAQVEMSFPATSTLDQCGEQGTMQSSPSGNVLVGCAEDVIREFDAAGTMLWEADAVCAEGEAVEVARWYPLEGWRPVPSTRVP